MKSNAAMAWPATLTGTNTAVTRLLGDELRVGATENKFLTLIGQLWPISVPFYAASGELPLAKEGRVGHEKLPETRF